MSPMLAANSLHRRLDASLLCVLLLTGLLGTLGSFLVVRGLATHFDLDTRVRQANQLAFWSIVPDSMLLVALAVAVPVVVRRCLRPLERLGRRVCSLDPGKPQTLERTDSPAELTAFIEAINRAMERLVARKEADRQFIANATHALRTPTAAIQLQVSNLFEAPPEQRADRLDELQRGISRVASLASRPIRSRYRRKPFSWYI